MLARARRRAAAKANTVHHHAGIDEGKNMEVAIIRRESCGEGSDLFNESETITKYEVMDGAPVRGESVPVRVFLGGFNLTPTFRNVNNKFSVKYFLNIVLVDEQDRRYFKQQEIELWRNEIG